MHKNYILKVEVFKLLCSVGFLLYMSYNRGAYENDSGLSEFSKESWIKCACLHVCVCGALYEAVIVSFLAALKQSDNPGVVNPRTAAQAVSTHPDSTQERTLS